MKKKYSLIFICIILSIFFTSCLKQAPNMPVVKKKPNNFYYTSELYKNLKKDDAYSIKLFETNLYKEVEVSKENNETLNNFISSLKTENFISKPEVLKEKPEFQLFIKANDEKYVINIYDEKYISIHPWDGVFSMDYINMEDIHKAYNLYGFCKYILKR